MGARSVVAVIAIVIVGALVMFGHARGQDEPYPVDLNIGETFDVCASGLIRCPPIGNICDDPKVAIPVDIPGSGLGFRGVGSGRTLCSAGSVSGFRRVFRITVR